MNAAFSRYHLRAVFFIALASLLIPFLASAQTNSFDGGMRNIEGSLFITTEPSNPAPGQAVHMKVESPLIDLKTSEIVWRVDGKIVTQGTRSTETDAFIDTKGSPLSVDIAVTDPTWGTLVRSITITPIELDLLYDAPTFVPPFYRGRALPTSGSTIRLQAIARFPTRSGILSPSAITYTWSKNGRVLGTLSGLGKSTVILDAPQLYSSDTITVKATSADALLSTSASVTIRSRDPILALYQDHPLYGIMYHRRFEKQTNIPDREMTFAVIPYFADSDTAEDPRLTYDWRVNNTSIAATSSDRSRITIRATASGDVANIDLNLSHSANLFMSAEGKWNITFGGGTGVNLDSKNDPFHSNQ